MRSRPFVALICALALFVACAPAALVDKPNVAEDTSDDVGDASVSAKRDTGASIGKDAESVSDAGTPNGDAGAQWNDVASLSDEALVSALLARIGNHHNVGYTKARGALFGVTGQLDFVGAQFECLYTGKLGNPDGSNAPNGFNTEHTWPQSLGAQNDPAKSDLHHLFPATADSNNARGNSLFGMTDCDKTSSCAFSQAGSELGVQAGGGQEVFEVRPARRGDVARAHFYFSVRYSIPITATEEPTLREWNQSDPPDDRERLRNDAVEALQKNRNPFIDRPEFVDQIADF